MNEKLYPELPEQCRIDVEHLIGTFKQNLIDEAEKAILTLYTDISPYIEGDMWVNMRRSIEDGLCDYPSVSHGWKEHYRQMRAKILEEHYDEIIKDLNGDLLEKISSLESTINALSRGRW